MRLFIALALPSIHSHWLTERQAELKNVFQDHSLRWTKPEQWHLTLRFLGECSESRARTVLPAIKEAVAGVAPLSIALGKPGTFSEARSGVLWVGVETGHDALRALAERINHTLESAGFPLENQVFRGHVTLARSRAKIPGKTLREMTWMSESPLAEVNSVHLYKSDLYANGAKYTLLHSVYLSKIV